MNCIRDHLSNTVRICFNFEPIAAEPLSHRTNGAVFGDVLLSKNLNRNQELFHFSHRISIPEEEMLVIVNVKISRLLLHSCVAERRFFNICTKLILVRKGGMRCP